MNNGPKGYAVIMAENNQVITLCMRLWNERESKNLRDKQQESENERKNSN